MCGITGIYAFNQVGMFNMLNLPKATRSLTHRGPDFGKSMHRDSIGLGHRRLSVIDPSPEAHQPFFDPTGRYGLVFNGEIYNYKLLAQTLLAHGVELQTESDTEVLLHLLIREGSAALFKLNGFFSFCLVDFEEQSLLLARDRFGIKPLYYFFDQDRFLFGSEMRSILAYGLPQQVNPQALYLYLQFHYLPAPHTMIQGIKKLEPGHMLEVRKKKLDHRPWYAQVAVSAEPENHQSFKQAVDETGSLLRSSVEQRLVADVPVGVFLSGGVDSSLVASYAAELQPGIRTFTIGYRGASFYDESKWAEKIAAHLGTEHETFRVSINDLQELMPEVMNQIDDPFADSSSLPVYLLSQLTRKEVTVALSGDGADEIFGGYYRHQAMARALHPGMLDRVAASMRGLWRQLPRHRKSYMGNLFRRLDRFATLMQLDPGERYWFLSTLTNESAAAGLMHHNLLEALDTDQILQWKMRLLRPFGLNSLAAMLQTDQALVLPDDMLTKVDRMSMAHGLEVRVPFLDHQLVETVNRYPLHWKMTGSRRKILLEALFRQRYPSSLFRKRKKGFEVPLDQWLHKGFTDTIQKWLLDEDFIRHQGIWEAAALKRLVHAWKNANQPDQAARVWSLLVFQQWWHNYFSAIHPSEPNS